MREAFAQSIPPEFAGAGSRNGVSMRHSIPRGFDNERVRFRSNKDNRIRRAGSRQLSSPAERKTAVSDEDISALAAVYNGKADVDSLPLSVRNNPAIMAGLAIDRAIANAAGREAGRIPKPHRADAQRHVLQQREALPEQPATTERTVEPHEEVVVQQPRPSDVVEGEEDMLLGPFLREELIAKAALADERGRRRVWRRYVSNKRRNALFSELGITGDTKSEFESLPYSQQVRRLVEGQLRDISNLGLGSQQMATRLYAADKLKELLRPK